MRVRSVVLHGGAIAVLIAYPPNSALLLLFLVSYVIRAFGTEAVYHRYFSHRAFRAGRLMQFFLALIGVQSGLLGPLYWAAVHRVHHRVTDTVEDLHSPVANSVFYSHMMWFRIPRNRITHLDIVPDLARYPELRWLNRYHSIPFWGCGALIFAAGALGLLGPDVSGASAFGWGFLLPVVANIHVFFAINSIAHTSKVPGGYRRYRTADCSRNRPVLAVLSLGAGWHNNHHRYPVPARAGFAWYEIDITYYILRMLNALCLIHHLKSRIPGDVLEEGGIGLRAGAGASSGSF